MVSDADFGTLRITSLRSQALLSAAVGLFVAGLGAAHFMDVNGHWVTGMNNHVVWGVPHVFAIFLIIAASGCLNVASLGTVFEIEEYKPYARIGALLSVALLIGGLGVLVLDLGRPDRLVVAMTHFNFASVFTWNVFLYTGFVGVVTLYLWCLMDPQVRVWAKPVGLLILAWRFVLTSGTGFIFGFLVARDSYDAALLAPLFVALSLSCGLAVFIVVVTPLCKAIGVPLASSLTSRMGRLLMQLVLLTLYLVAALHIGAGYVAEHAGFELFLLANGGGFTTAFWIGFVLFGSLVPALLLATPIRESAGMVMVCACLVIAGAFTLLYLIIIAGQVYPMDLVPGYTVVATTFFDGAPAPYAASFPELLLGFGGIGFAIALVMFATRVLRLVPVSQRRPWY